MPLSEEGGTQRDMRVGGASERQVVEGRQVTWRVGGQVVMPVHGGWTDSVAMLVSNMGRGWSASGTGAQRVGGAPLHLHPCSQGHSRMEQPDG